MTREDEFEAKLALFGANEILLKVAFHQTFAASSEFELQEQIRKHRARAVELGVSAKDFNAALKAYKADLHAKAALYRPVWLTKDGVDEPAFLDEFNAVRGYRCINGQLYIASRGFVPDGEVEADIQKRLEGYVTKRLHRTAHELLGALKNRCWMAPPPAEPGRVYFRNGWYSLEDGSFHPDIDSFTLYRVAVDFEPEAPAPQKWLDYVGALLDAEDIPTLQEFCGYALIPTTRAQRMLFIIGNGGEGKSVAGAVLAAIFGQTAAAGRLHDIEERFGLAGLEGKLLFIDDDLATAKLRETANVKKIVTAQTPILVERKGRDAYPARIYCRLMCFGNQLTDSLYDHSNGAFRRRLILTTKPRDPARVDNPQLAELIIRDELPGVVLWMLDGLKRLQANNWKFTVSEKQRQQEQAYKEDSFNLLAFLNDREWIVFDPTASVTSRELYTAYCRWCMKNGEDALAQKTVLGYLKSNGQTLHISYSKHILSRDGIDSRGFLGIGACFSFQRWAAGHVVGT